MLELLREGTADEHRRVEAHPLLRPLVDGTLSLATYGGILRALAEWMAGLDDQLAVQVDRYWRGTGYRYQARLPLLAEDLAAVTGGASAGMPAVFVPDSSKPASSIPPLSVDTPDALLGVLYVVEGSTQGGRVIAPRVRRLGLDGNRGARYFQLYEAGGWRAFRALACRSGVKYDAARCLDAARQTFDDFHAILEVHFNAPRG